MRFGLFGSAQARRSGPDTDSSQGFREFIENNVEAEALGYYSTFLVEHHFTGFGQVSASLNLLTWLGARTTDLRLGTAVLVLPWHNPVLLAEQAATLTCCPAAGLISGSARDTGTMNLPASASLWKRQSHGSKRRWRSSPRPSPRKRRFRIGASIGNSTTSSSSRQRRRNHIHRSGWGPAV
jgi:Luciferase-like monooxygenase